MNLRKTVHDDGRHMDVMNLRKMVHDHGRLRM
jgi:hypothetical protein